MARMSLSSRVAMLCAAVCLLIPLGPVAATGTVADGARSGSYIVVLRPGATARTAVAHAADAARRYGLRVNAVYRHALQGYAATIPDEALAALRADPSVAFVEPDRAVTKRNEPPATRSGALTDSALKGDTPRSCLRANDADPNRARLQLCIKGLSMLSIRGIQPGSGPPPDPRTRESLDRRATGLPCTAAPGDDRCEAWAARFDHAHLNVFESPLGMAVSPIGDRVFVAGLDWDLKRGEQTMAIVAYEGRTGRREWTSLPFSGDGGGCAGCAVTGIAASPDGTRVYVTGFTQNSGTSADIRTLALDAASGAVVWDDRYNSHADPYKAVDTGVAIAVSPNGRWVYATGTITDLSGPVTKFRNVLIGYDPRSGRRQWISRSVLYDSYNQIRATGDRVYATGSGLNAGGSHFGAVTVAIDGRTGAPSWRRMYNGDAGAVGDDNGLDLVVSQDGSRVYMTGYTTTGLNGQLSWLTAAYAAGSGRSVWTRRHADQPGQNVAHAIAVSPSGDRVYAVGYTTGRDDRFKPATAAYDGATGAPAWTQRYALQRYSGGQARGVAVSPDGSRIYLTGFYSNAAAGFDYLTLALDAADGAHHWIARHNSAYRSAACLSADGAFYLGQSPNGRRIYSAGTFGSYYDPNTDDFGTLAYETVGGDADPSPGRPPAPPASACPQIQSWGVDRIDADVSSTLAGNGSGRVAGVNVYVVDGGIDGANPELNVVDRVNFTIGPDEDCGGHGTAVAGVIGARDNATGVVGVAPGVAMTSVKVLDCSGVGTLGQVLSGIDWVTANAAKPAVVNMSLQFTPSRAIDEAVAASADSGIFYSVMAGNGRADCSEGSPARIGTHPHVMAVAATDQTGRAARFSDYGPCVSVWAPGYFVLTTRLHGGDTFASGTDLAAPHVAGTAALYLSTHPWTSPATLKQILIRDAVLTGFVSNDGTTPVLQVYAGRY